MIIEIIKKIRTSNTLADHEREYLEFVMANPSHKEYPQLYLAGLV